jgi:hypothetical protein
MQIVTQKKNTSRTLAAYHIKPDLTCCKPSRLEMEKLWVVSIENLLTEVLAAWNPDGWWKGTVWWAPVLEEATRDFGQAMLTTTALLCSWWNRQLFLHIAMTSSIISKMITNHAESKGTESKKKIQGYMESDKRYYHSAKQFVFQHTRPSRSWKKNIQDHEHCRHSLQQILHVCPVNNTALPEYWI